MSRKYEYLEHTADIVVAANGDTLEEAFAAAAEGMYGLIAGGRPVALDKTRELNVQSIDVEGLLVTFLSELLLLFDTELFLSGSIEVKFTGRYGLTAILKGSGFDREKHGEGIPVKGVSYHLLEIGDPADKPARVQVLLDI